jgi:hypothetical protein
LTYHKNLCAKSLKINILTVVSKSVILSQFKDVFSDMESEHGDALYYTEVCWLSRGQTLKRVCDLKSKNELFLETKGKPFPQLCNRDWLCDSAFCIDIA